MALSDEKEARLRGLLALHENEHFRYLLTIVAQEEQAVHEQIYSGHLLSDGISGVLLREQAIGQVRGLRRLPQLMLAEITSLSNERKESETNEQVHNEQNPA